MKTELDLILPSNPKLRDFQKYVSEMEEVRGFNKNTILELSLKLGEEVGELFKAIRKKEKIRIDEKSKIGSIEEELTDIFIYLCSIANKYSIDLEKSFRGKEEINKKRTWI